MNDNDKTREELIKELSELHSDNAALLTMKIDRERIKAEAVQQHGGERWQFLVDKTSAWIWQTDANLRHIYTNAFVTKCLGYLPEELMSYDTLQLIHIDDHAIVEKIVQDARENKAGWINQVLRWRHKDGSWRYFESCGTALFDEAGNFTGLHGVDHDITEREQAEKAVRESEEKYRALVETSYDWIWEVDKQGVYTYASPRVQNILGYAPEEVVGRTPFDFMPPDEQVRVIGRFRELVANRGPIIRLENKNLRKDGGEVIFETSGLPIFDAEGAFKGYRGIDRDITDRKRVEEALWAISSRQKAILAAVPDIIMEVDSNKKYTWANEAGRRFFGDDVIGKEAVFYFEGEQDTYQIVQPLFEGAEDVIYIESWQRRQDGEKRLLAWWCQVLKDGEGNVTGALSTARDITGQKQAELTLKEKEEKYRSLFEAATDGIFILGANGFIDCNQKGADMYGLPKEKLIGRRPIEFSPDRQPNGQSSSMLAGEIIEAAMRGIPKTFEWQSKRADGSLFDVDINLNRIELGGEICLQAVVRDITDRKRLEQEIVKTQKLEAIGTLAGGIAHDFNNLLQGIFGYISMAKLTHDQKEKSLAMLEQAEQALHMSVNLTKQLLTFSKGGKPVKRTMHLQPLIENSVKFALSGSKSDYKIMLNEDLWAVEADEGQIGQVFQNIVLNADQAMPEGGTIEITAKNVQQEQTHYKLLGLGRYVEISIRDTGIGIPEKYLQKIFDPYFTTKEKGNGLGLATSYSIIKKHGGVIDVESEVGRGTTFFIYLPAVEAAKEIRQETAAVTVARKGKILVMDDEELVLNIAGEMMKALGHDIDLAKHGQSAIEKYRAAMESGNPYDIVILDLTIRGGMGGRETIEQLLAIDAGAKAIVSSGYSDDAVVSEYHKYGFKAFLSKPYKIEALRDTLNMLLGS